MSPPTEYKVMGENGQEYEPVTTEQIRKWILEQRLDRKTPVKPVNSPDWVFLESLPEFADIFQPPTPLPKSQREKWPLVVGILLTAVLIVLVRLFLKKFNHH